MLLALDIANKTGFKTRDASGVWDLTPRRGETGGMSVVRFRARLEEVVVLSKIGIVAVEQPSGRHKASLVSMAKKHGVLEEYCNTHGVEVVVYTPSEIKRFATGAGNCNKAAMVSACKERWGIDPADDNEADAVHLYYLACRDLAIK